MDLELTLKTELDPMNHLILKTLIHTCNKHNTKNQGFCLETRPGIPHALNNI